MAAFWCPQMGGYEHFADCWKLACGLATFSDFHLVRTYTLTAFISTPPHREQLRASVECLQGLAVVFPESRAMLANDKLTSGTFEHSTLTDREEIGSLVFGYRVT